MEASFAIPFASERATSRASLGVGVGPLEKWPSSVTVRSSKHYALMFPSWISGNSDSIKCSLGDSLISEAGLRTDIDSDG